MPLLSGFDETVPLARYFKGAGDSRCRLFSFFQDLLPVRRSSASRLEQPRRQRADHPEIGVAESIGTRFPCRRRFHHPKRLDVDAINHATRRIGSRRLGQLVSRTVSAALSDVLGRTFGLPGFTFRGASRTGG